MSEFKKTIFLDIDGCIFKHNGNMSTQFDEPELLPGVIVKLNEWDAAGYKLILVTGRKESMRKLTEEQLANHYVFYDQLIMGLPRGQRIVINDAKPRTSELIGEPTVQAIELERNEGLTNVIL